MQMEDLTSKLYGNWEKISTDRCCAIYPEHLQFREHGIYFGTSGPDEATIWGVGSYRLLSESRIILSDPDDAHIEYSFSLSDESLVFVDENDCEVQYRRI